MSSQPCHLFRSPGIPKGLPRSTSILNACSPGAWERVGGVSLAARTLFHLRELGVTRVILLLSSDDRLHPEIRKWQGGLELNQVRVKGDIPSTILSISGLESPFLYIDTTHLIDPRLINTFLRASETTFLFMDPEEGQRKIIRAGLMSLSDLSVWVEQGPGALMDRGQGVFPGDIDPYSPEIRGPLVPYFMEVRSREEAREATRILIRSQQKQVMDLPAQYIDPPFENALTLILCNLPITPNMVTYAGVVAAMVVAWLFWHGCFLTGALITFAVEILDGVDGKLARTTLQYSRLGRHESVIDYFCENSWYASLAVGLGGSAANLFPVLLGGLLIFSDTLDNIFYTLAEKWYGRNIDLFSPFDAAFRRVAGRRNIYGMIFIFGFLLGFPLITFAVAAGWAALTAGVHGVRFMQYERAIKGKYGQQSERIP
jgi:phosphatidylglycerophosphate synthase